MLVGMDVTPDPHHRSSLLRHLRAVDSRFRELPAARHREDDPLAPAGDDFTRRQLDLFGRLIQAVGSADALWCLDVLPLPDEPFDWSAVEPCDAEFVAAGPRAVRSLLRRAVRRRVPHRGPATRGAGCSERPASVPSRPARGTSAASLVWLIGAANGDFDRGGRYPSSWLWSWFGVGSCADRARTVYRAAGLEPKTTTGGSTRPLSAMRPCSCRSRAPRIADRRDHMLDVAERRRTGRSSVATAQRAGRRARPTHAGRRTPPRPS